MTPRLRQVRESAISLHGNQMYGDNKPYIYHIDKAVDVLHRFGFDEVKDQGLFAALYFHDVLEDTSTSVFNLLQWGFSNREVELIYAVTNEEGRNRKERHEKTYGKIVSTVDAIILKLADRIANVEEKGKIGMYRKEHRDFTSVLRRARTTRPVEVALMWEHLHKLINLRENEPEQ